MCNTHNEIKGCMMATLPKLVTALAEVDGRERKTVEHIARVIREAGFIPTGKRGGGAPKMDCRSAANLIIGLHGADAPMDAPAVINIFRTLTPGPCYLADGMSPYFNKIGRTRTFGQALELLIEDAPKLLAKLDEIIAQTFEGPHQHKSVLRDLVRGRRHAVIFEIRLSRFAVVIRCMAAESTLGEWGFYAEPDTVPPEMEIKWNCDRRVTSSFSIATLLEVWCCLQGLELEAIASPPLSLMPSKPSERGVKGSTARPEMRRIKRIRAPRGARPPKEGA